MSEPNEAELRAKVQEFYELLCGQIPNFIRATVIAQHIKDGHIAREMRDFYATYGRLPVIERNPSGIGLVMEGKDEDQRPVAQEDPLEPRISEETRRFGREDKELRTALRSAFCRREPAHLEELAKHHGMTPEQLTERELDAYVEYGWGEAFRLFHAKHLRYPDHTELNEVAWMALEENENWKANES